MKQRNIARIVLCLLAVAMGSMLYWAISKHKSKYAGIQQFPQIQALTIFGDYIDVTEHLSPSKRTALLFFHPECEYCRKEVEGIMARHSECRDVQWLFLTLAPAEEVEMFLLEYPLESIPDAYVLREDWPDNHKMFGVKGPPALFIYDENGKLMARHMGATSIKIIVQELQ